MLGKLHDERELAGLDDDADESRDARMSQPSQHDDLVLELEELVVRLVLVLEELDRDVERAPHATIHCRIVAVADRMRHVAQLNLVGIEHQRERTRVLQQQHEMTDRLDLERNRAVDVRRALERESHCNALLRSRRQLASMWRERHRTSMIPRRQMQRPYLFKIVLFCICIGGREKTMRNQYLFDIGTIGERDLVLIDMTDFAVKARRDIKVEHTLRYIERPLVWQILHTERQRQHRRHAIAIDYIRCRSRSRRR